MLNQERFDSSGATPISFTWAQPTGGGARQLFNYQHNADNGYGPEVSRIPNDCIVVDYSICTRTAQRPDAVWTAPKPQLPYLYGGYIPSGLRQRDVIDPDRVAVDRTAGAVALPAAPVRQHQPVVERHAHHTVIQL
ncbi:hypothetical protein ACWGCW_01890 [Streptomyces sp. NPDC054933]